jgi:alpha-mannosidase
MKHKILHMIGNAHLDPVWLWRWQEGFQAAKATFRSVLDRMDEYDDFLFTSSSAAIYEWVEHNDPRMFQEIRARVAEGRWQIVGGWWIQPDCNLPAGESFVRQGLYGQRYFQEKLGVTATVGYNVDSFGHHAMLPQILKKSGLNAYVFTRPEPHEKGLPGRLFWWESDDGARVLAFRIPFEYCTWGKDLERYVRRCFGELRAPYDELMVFYGVGNHGGGPTRENIESIQRMDSEPDFPRLIFGTPNTFFERMLASDLPFPVVHDELQHHASGCYAVHSGIKRWNRQAENTLLLAEKWSAIAELVTGQPYPHDIDRAWKNVLFNQFHDILAGTSLEAAYDDARDLHGEAMSIAGRALNNAVQSLAWNVDIPFEEGMLPIVVFNPHAWPSATPVELDIGGVKEGDILVDDAGHEVAVQLVRPPVIVSGWRRKIAFVADLPPLGYRTYRVLARAAATPPPPPSNIPPVAPVAPIDLYMREIAAAQMANQPDEGEIALTPPFAETDSAEIAQVPPAPVVDPSQRARLAPSPRTGPGDWAANDRVLENRRLRLTIDHETGCIGSLFDKQHGVEVFLGQGAQPIVIDDPSDTWGHGVYEFGAGEAAFVPSGVRLFERGPVRAAIRADSTYGASTLAQEFTLYRELELIEVRVTLDWRERFKLLKLAFPLNLNFFRATYEIPYGFLERPTNGEEEPGQSWLDLSGSTRGTDVPYGLSLLNDGKSSFDVRGRDMRMTVLRSPIYAHHHPTLPHPDESHTFIDHRNQRFTYWLLPHANSWEQAGTVHRAAELNQRPVALVETFHPGPLPQRDSFLSVDCDNVVASVVKRGEDGDDLVVRCYETNRVAIRATIRLPKWGREIVAEFGPCEIKTFRIPRDTGAPVVETNLIEWT